MILLTLHFCHMAILMDGLRKLDVGDYSARWHIRRKLNECTQANITIQRAVFSMVDQVEIWSMQTIAGTQDRSHQCSKSELCLRPLTSVADEDLRFAATVAAAIWMNPRHQKSCESLQGFTAAD